ncbi:MAG: glycoside hydrolase family 36 protein [Oligoflexales bacterium]
MKLRTILWLIVYFTCQNNLLANIEFSPDGIALHSQTSSLHLKPSIQFDLGEWLELKECKPLNQNTSHCSVGDVGFLQIKLTGNQVHLSFYADKDIFVSGIGLQGVGNLIGARAVLSNGVQSWSQSGIIKLPKDRVNTAALKKALKVLDQKEEHRKGNELSWDHSFIQGSNEALFLGTLSAKVFRTWIQAYQLPRSEQVSISIKSGGIYDKRLVPKGTVLRADPYQISITDNLPIKLSSYAKNLPRRATAKNNFPDIGWNSWYEHFDEVSDQDIERSANRIKYFVQDGFAKYQINTNKPVVYIDDGWEKEWGVWEPNDKFSKGLFKMAQDIKELGYIPGIWLAPLLHRKYGKIPRLHPEWFLQAQVYPHASGDYLILDVTHPDAAEYLQSSISKLVQSGFSHLKIDFLIAGLFPGKRYQNATTLDAYHLAMKLIREAAGPETQLLACGAPLLASIKYVDSWRVGADIAYEFPAKQKGSSWVDVANQARNIGARWFLCEAIHCDADPLLLRGPIEPRFQSSAWVTSLSGGGLFLSDDLSKLQIEQWENATQEAMLMQTISGKPARPNPLVPSDLPTYLETPNLSGRIFGNQFIKVPNQWLTATGQTLVINFNSQTLMGPDGSYIPVRESKLYD